jgi:hypothetical protein
MANGSPLSPPRLRSEICDAPAKKTHVAQTLFSVPRQVSPRANGYLMSTDVLYALPSAPMWNLKAAARPPPHPALRNATPRKKDEPLRCGHFCACGVANASMRCLISSRTRRKTFNSERMDARLLGAGARDLEAIAGAVAQKSLCHLTAGRVVRAEE